jgi:hypothetical protein
MATVTSWTESLPAGDTAIYPFVGTEWLWLLIAVVFWLVWHFKTSAAETQEHDELASKGKSSSDYKKNIANW